MSTRRRTGDEPALAFRLEQFADFLAFDRGLAERTVTAYLRDLDGLVAFLVERGGFAALVWRGRRAWFVARGFEQPATDDQVASIRSFADDLDWALKAPQ